jgi:hypothetical protein
VGKQHCCAGHCERQGTVMDNPSQHPLHDVYRTSKWLCNLHTMQYTRHISCMPQCLVLHGLTSHTGCGQLPCGAACPVITASCAR